MRYELFSMKTRSTTGSRLTRNQIGEIRESRGSLGGCRHSAHLACALGNASTLIVEKEEPLAAAVIELRYDYRSAEGEAKLVLAVTRLSRSGGEIVAGVENVVADELPGVAMKGVSAGFGRFPIPTGITI